MWSLSNKIRGFVKKWENQNAQSYDSAQKGSSALTAALHRNILIELAFWLNMATILVLLDFAKFFDTMDPVYLMMEAQVYGYP